MFEIYLLVIEAGAPEGFEATKKIFRPEGVDEILIHHFSRKARPVGCDRYLTEATNATKAPKMTLQKTIGIQMKAVKKPMVSQIGAVKKAITKNVKKTGTDASATAARSTGGM